MITYETRAFRMQLNPGLKDEYKRRHDELWPELRDLLKQSGIREYRIFLDEETHALFGILECPNTFDGKKLAQEPVMRKWWDYMADIMQTHSTNEPVAIPLSSVFYLP
jgi:L-rhamnose mutarotase